MPKFFVDEQNITKTHIEITGEDVNHIKNVLRKNIQDKIEVCSSNSGQNYLVEIANIENEKISCEIIETIEESSESKIHVHIFQGLPKSDKMELIIQKAVELGAKEITPTNMKRCIVKLDSKDAKKKVERWKRISEVAAKQCGRDIIPKINEICTLNQILEQRKDYDVIILAYENEKEKTLKQEIDLLKQLEKENLRVAIIIGPEGGIAPEEMEKLKKEGIKVVTLGKRILRTETVALNILSIIMYEFE